MRNRLLAAVPVVLAGSRRNAQRSTVIGEHVRVLVAELLQQPRRASNVREQERDGAGRKLAIAV
jgi:hypothetical protein